MTGPQGTLIAASLLILAIITAVVQLRWLRPGRVQTVLVFLAGIAAVASLWAAGVPPAWFAGEKAGFGITASLGLGAILYRTSDGDARAFGFPLLLGMSMTLFVANAVGYAQRVL
jgi:hypothetical protein